MAAQIDFAPSRVKIKGANGNIDRLLKMTSPLDRSLYEIVMEEKRGPFIYLNPPTYYELTYRPKEPIPETRLCGDNAFDLILGVNRSGTYLDGKG